MNSPCLKSLISLLLITILLSPLSLFTPTAKAIGSLDLIPLGFIVTNTGMLVAKEVAKTAFDWLKFAKELAGSLLKKLILDRYVDALIVWINNGGKGSVIENWDAFLRDAGQFAVGEVAKELGAGFLCAPFNLQLQIAVNPPRKFSQQLNCSLDQITGNIDAFIENFENGGWIAYQEQWYPQNNFYGGVLIALNEADLRASAAKEAALGEAITGGGFLSYKKCDSDGTNCHVVTPGSFVSSAAKSAYIDIPSNSIVNANDIASYVTSIADAAINRLVKSGIEGLTKSRKKTSSYTNVTFSNPCSGLTGEAFSACAKFQNISESVLAANHNELISQINLTLKPRQEAASLLNQLINSQSTLTDSLNQLTSCEPANSNAREQAQTEQQTLDGLKNKYDANQTFVEPLERAVDNINLGDLQSRVIEFNSIQSLLDPETANSFLSLIKETDQKTITDNVNEKLPSIKSQLATCSTTP